MAKNINVVLTLQDKFTKKMNEASYETLKFKRNLALAQTVSDKFAGVMHTMETAAVVGIGAAGTAITAASKSVLDEYEKFNNAMNRVEGLKGVGTTVAEMESLTKAAKETARSIKGTTYNDAADALYYLAQAGLNTEQSMAALPGIMKAIKIQGGDAQTVADATTDAMETLGLAASQTGEYVDKCAAVQVVANTDMLQLEESVKKCASAMVTFGKKSGVTGEELDKNLNDSVNDTLALIGLLSADKKGSEAGTAINSIYRRITKDSAEAQDGLEELGLSVYDSAGNLKRAEPLFREMGELMENLTPKERNSILSKIGGYYASDLQLIIDGIRNVSEETGMTLYEQLENAILAQEGKNGINGAADAYINAIAKGYGGAVATLAASWTNFKIDAGEIIAPYATDVLNYITGKLPVIQEWLENNLPSARDKGKEIIIEIKDALNEFKPVMQWIIDHWQQIAVGAGTVYTGMGAFRIGTGALEAYDTISQFSRGLGKQREAKDALWDNAKGLMVPDSTGKRKRNVHVDTSSVVTDNIFDTFTGVTEQTRNYDMPVKESFPLDLGNVIDVVEDVDDNRNTILRQSALGLDDISPIFKDGVKEGLEEAVDTTAKTKGKKGILSILGGVADTGLSLAGMAGTATAGAATGGGATVGSMGGIASGIMGTVGSGAVGGAATVAAPFIALAAILVGAYTQSENLRKSVKNFADNALGGVKSGLGKVKDGLKDGWEAAQPFVDVLKEGLKNVGDALAPVLNFLSPVVEGLGEIVGMGLGAIFEGIGTFLGKIAEAFQWINDKLDPFTSKIEAAWEWLSDLSEEFSEFIGLVTKDEETAPSEYKTLAYEGDPSMINGTITEQNNPGGGVTSEQEGGEGEGNGLEPYLKSDGTWGYRPAFSTSTIGETTGALTDNAKIRIQQSDAFTNEEKMRLAGTGPSQTDNVEHKALGTNYWKGGITHVNERGGEIMDLPRGTRIYPADKSKKMMSEKATPTVIVNIENFYGEDERYIERVGDKIAHKLAMNM